MAKRQRRRRQQRRGEHAKREGWKTRHSLITGAGLVAGAIGVGPAAAQAAYLYVGSTGDGTGASDCATSTNTDCTLRQAVSDANANPDCAYISFRSCLSGTITLGSEIDISNPVSIYGPNSNNPSQLTVSGDSNYRIFNIDMDTSGDYVGVNSLRLADGDAHLGGAIFNYDSVLSIFNSVLTGNDAYAGGALYEYGDYDGGTDTRITFSTLSGNDAAFGGGVAARQSFGLIGGSTFNGNDAYAGGALIAPPAGGGGAIFDSTISGNDAAYTGGVSTEYVFPFYNSILANNTGGTYPDVFSSYIYGLASLIENPGPNPIYGSYNITGQDPLLGGLANNGGPTPTLRPAFNSPVVDAGYTDVQVDQRFSYRPIDIASRPNRISGFYGAADIGSVELTTAEATPPPSPPAPAPVVKKKKKCKKKKKKNHAAQSAKKKKCKKKKKRAASAVARQAVHAWQDEARTIRDAHPRQLRDGVRQHHRIHWADQAWRQL